MENTNTNIIETIQHSAIAELIENLLKEAYAVKHDFSELNLDGIGKLIEDERERFEHPDTLSSELLSEMESFERCKSLYCLILLEFEQLSFINPPEEILAQLRTPEQRETLFISEEESSASGTAPTIEYKKNYKHNSQLERMQSKEASQYFSFFEYLETLNGNTDNPASETTLDRFKGVALCFSVESELIKAMMPYIETFWNTKKVSVTSILTGQGHGLELHPELKTGLEPLIHTHGHWLHEGKFPLAAVMNSVKYILSVQNLNKFRPAPADIAVMLLFFGHQMPIGHFEIQNFLRITGLDQKQILELAFRLTRLQKMKVRVSSLSNEFTKKDLHQLEEDSKAVLNLVAKLHTEDAGHLQGVA